MKLVVADLNEKGIFRPVDEILGNRNVPNDTGLCNRLLVWELVKIVNHIHDNNFEVVVDINQNPESTNCINLQNTTVLDIRKIKFNNYTAITDDMIQDIIDGKLTLDTSKNYYTDFSKRQICDFFSGKYPTRFITGLKFIHDDINDQIQNAVGGVIGIHVRRGRGVKIHNDTSSIQMNVNLELDSSSLLPRYVFDDNIKNTKMRVANSIDLDLFEGWNHRLIAEYVGMKLNDMPAWEHYQFDFINDEVYFEKIDTILDKNPKQKFYISHDLEYSFFRRWLRRYPKNLIFKEDFYKLVSSWEIPLELNTKNFIDLYALCNTKHIFTVPQSTWSELACDFNNKVGIDITSISNKDLLNKVYQKNLL
tara:strand:- start:419 stop:1510 length:1092 start_codon:yes stop_codon:yes gene_type:complete